MCVCVHVCIHGGMKIRIIHIKILTVNISVWLNSLYFLLDMENIFQKSHTEYALFV